MSNRTEITERKVSTPNILLTIKKFLRDTTEVTNQFYFFRIFWKFEIKYNELPAMDSFVTMIVHKAPKNYPMLAFSVDCGMLSDKDTILFEQKGLTVTLEDIITKKNGCIEIWRCRLSALMHGERVFTGSTLRYLCRIHIENGWENVPELHEERIPIISPSCIHSLTGDLKNLLDTSIMTDVVLKCGEQEFPAHKCILSSRSPVFKAMFENDFKESRDDVVDITDVKPTVFQKLIDYIYTGNIDTDKECVDSMSDLLKVADKYCIQSLTERCIFYLKENLDPHNACNLLVMSAFYGYSDFKDFVVSYLANRGEFLLSEDWVIFAKENMELAQEVFLQYVRISECNKNLKNKN